VPTSFKRWSELLDETVRSGALAAELPIWRDIVTGPDRPVGDRPLDPAVDTAVTTRSLTVGLAAEHTTQLETIDEAHQQQIADLKAAHDAQVDELTSAHEQQLAELSASHERQTSELIAEKESLASETQAEAPESDSTLSEVRSDLADAVARAEQAASDLEESRAEIAALREERDRSAAQRDAAIEELDGVTAQRGEWENRLRLTVAALASTDVVGDWTEDNAPDERLVEFVQSTTQALEQKIGRIEQIATEELVDETETNEYAIGANDAAVRVLNALDDVEADAPIDAP
jgi:chromosome segregation ATPase